MSERKGPCLSVRKWNGWCPQCKGRHFPGGRWNDNTAKGIWLKRVKGEASAVSPPLPSPTEKH